MIAAAIVAAVFSWSLPPGFPLPLTSGENVQTQEKFELGRRLFYDRRLSGNNTQACGDCHQQSRAFTDGRATAIGSTGATHTRNTMTLTNAAYNASYTWDNTRVRSLEQQAFVPMFNEHPVELGVGGREKEILARFANDEARFRKAFPGERRPLSMRNIARALASFERALISGRSAYDLLVFDVDDRALSDPALRGMRLFFSPRSGCSGCHSGFNLSGDVRHVGRSTVKPQLVNNGVTRGTFRVPTLRNVELTAPYMHDGSVETIAEVINRYSDARKLGLDSGEKADLRAFLESLTDHAFVTDARFAPP